MIRTLTPLAFCCATALPAQVILDEDLILPEGLSLNMYVLTDLGEAVPPTDGAAQWWDLSSVSLVQAGTLEFVAASATPYAASYPEANWAWAQDITGVGPDIVYLDISADGIDVLARSVPDDPAVYSDPARIVRFPLAYGTSYVDAYAYTNGSGSPTWSYSGYGTLSTPLNTYTNVAKVVSTEGDMLLWNTSPLYPLVIDNGDNVLFYEVDPDASVNTWEAGAERMAYPNPAQHTVWVEAGIGKLWRITDMQGRLLQQGRASNTVEAVDVQSLAEGSYVLSIIDQLGIRTVHFQKAD